MSFYIFILIKEQKIKSKKKKTEEKIHTLFFNIA